MKTRIFVVEKISPTVMELIKISFLDYGAVLDNKP